jgi:hypothetical protein
VQWLRYGGVHYRTTRRQGNPVALGGAIDMGRRKGEDSIASKKRRMPYVAKIKRDDPFCPNDERNRSHVQAHCCSR